MIQLERKEDYLQLLTSIVSGQNDAETSLAIESSGLSTNEKKALRALSSYHRGNVRTPQSYPLFTALLFSLLKTKITQVIAKCCVKLLLHLTPNKFLKRIFEALYPDFIHARYSDFRLSAVYSFLFFNYPWKSNCLHFKLYFGAHFGHFMNLCGRFDYGLPILKENLLELRKLSKERKLNAEERLFLIDSWSCACLSLTLSGALVKAYEAFDDAINFTLSNGLIYHEVFLRSMRMNLSVDQLNLDLLTNDTQRLKLILGDRFENIYGARASISTALVCALQKDFLSAKTHLIGSESFLNKVSLIVEQARYHATRALVDIELENYGSALTHCHHGKAKFDLVHGSIYHQAEIKILHTEILLRIALKHPETNELNSKNILHSLNKIERKLHKTIRSCPKLEAHLLLNNILACRLLGNSEKEQRLIKLFESKYSGISKRLNLVVEELKTYKKSTRSSVLEVHGRIETSLIEFMRELATEHDAEKSVSDLLNKILIAQSIQITRRKDHSFESYRSKKTWKPFSIEQTSEQTIVIVIYLPDEAVTITVINPLINLRFDRSFLPAIELSLHLASNMLARDAILKYEESTKLWNLASKLAHDIRSPLGALSAVFVGETTIPTDLKQIVQNAIQRIHSISEELLANQPTEKSCLLPTHVSQVSVHNVWLAIKELLSEKKVELNPFCKITFSTDLRSPLSELFSSFSSNELKSILSNLINNSVEANNEQPTELNISVVSELEKIVIRIKDNGPGISPEILSQLGSKILSHGKPNGRGLGLFNATNVLQNANGSLQIESIHNNGTQVTLKIPKTSAPSWFANCLTIPKFSNLFVVDDERDPFNQWSRKLDHANNVLTLTYFDSLHAASTAFGLNGNTYFAVDNHFEKEQTQGIDWIVSKSIQDRSILVTNDYNNPFYIEKCIKNNIRILPKPLVADFFVNII